MTIIKQRMNYSLLPRDYIAWENNVRWALKQRRYKVATRCNRAAAGVYIGVMANYKKIKK